MEELQNLRSDSEALEKEIAAPVFINFLKVFVKFAVAGVNLVALVVGRSCGEMMDDLILGGFIILACEAVVGMGILMFKYCSEKCVKSASFALICGMVFEVLCSICYVGWGIYITIVYFNENECGHDFSFEDIVGLLDVVYFLVALSIMACCCGAKFCICLSTLLASVKSNVERSLSHDLVNVRRESFIGD
jgi:hypothetical protein